MVVELPEAAAVSEEVAVVVQEALEVPKKWSSSHIATKASS